MIPGAADVNVEQTPQMVTVSFNGAVTGTNMAVYQSLLTKDSVNPNGCTAKATFFVSHKYTNYSAVQAWLMRIISFKRAIATSVQYI